MLLSLTEAKKYACEKVEQIIKEQLSEEEQALIEINLEQIFFDKIEGLLSEEQIAEAKAETPEELDAYMFNNIPKYATLLEETVAEFLVEYLDEEDEEGEQIEELEENTEIK